MTVTEHSEIVKASFETIWEQLLLKVYHPEKFIPGVSDVEIIETGPGDRVIRKMKVTFPTGLELNLLEKITWDRDSRTLNFTIIEHPTHSGNVINRVEINENN